MITFARRAVLLDIGMGLGISSNTIAVMEFDWLVLLKHLDQRLFLLLGHPFAGAGEAMRMAMPNQEARLKGEFSSTPSPLPVR
jgi:hypothetical protein